MPEPKPALPAAAVREGEPPVISGYELLRRIGQGSYGDVWLARTATDEYYAVKVVYRKTFEHDRPYERELSGIRKFEPVSRTHPSQVNILHVGEHEEYFYYVMELADDAEAEDRVSSGKTPGLREDSSLTGSRRILNPGTYVPKTLKSVITRHGRLPVAQCLEISLALTTALDHLHRHGLIHRDIKPSNVIFVNGVPKLADIGLVTDVGATISHVGTEGFLPPEGPGTPRADIFSLGKVLYEMSTGRDRLEFPELPTVLGDSPEERGLLELNLVFLKACQNEPARRYPSAQEMASDLALLHSGRSLKRAKALEQRLANVRRIAILTGLAAILAGFSYYLVEQRRLKQLRAQIAAQENEKQIFKTAALKTRQQFINACLANAAQLEAQRDSAGALLWLARAWQEDDEPTQDTLRSWITALLSRCPKISGLFIQNGPINSVALSPDSKLALTASADATARLWDITTGEAVGAVCQHASPVLCAAFSPDGHRVATGTGDGMVRVWNVPSGEPVSPPLKHGKAIQSVEFNPAGRQLLSVADDNAATIWEVASGKVRRVLSHEARVLVARFSPDGRTIVTAGADRITRIWDVNAVDARPLVINQAVEHVAFSPDSRRIAASSGPEARVWNTASGEAAYFVLRHDGQIHSIGFSPDGRWLATAGQDRTARIWDAVTGRPVVPPIPHKSSVHQVVFSPDGQWLLTASEAQVQRWDAFTGEPAGPALGRNGRVSAIEFTSDGGRVIVGSADHTAWLIELFDSPSATAWASQAANALTPLAQLLAGRQIENEVRVLPLAPAESRRLWRTLRAAHPNEFIAQAPPGWHRRQADEAEKQKHWFAARFHLERSLKVDPKNSSLLARREAATKQLEKDAAAARSIAASRLPPRSATAGANLLDLTTFYNASLNQTWYPTNLLTAGNDFAALPQGVQKFGGIEFDVRGLIQLAGSALENVGSQFPRQVTGIPVGRKCRRLHFLQGASWSTLFGAHIGSYQIHYVGGETREVRLIFGQNIRDWWFSPPSQTITGAAVAWEGSNAASRELGMAVRLYQMIWLNPLPDVEIASLDFRSTMEKPAPFLVAITTEGIPD